MQEIPNKTMILDSRQYRGTILSHYDDSNSRLMEIMYFCRKKTENKIFGLYDYKGVLNVLWKQRPTEEDKRHIARVWEDKGYEVRDNVVHYGVYEIPSKPHNLSLINQIIK